MAKKLSWGRSAAFEARWHILVNQNYDYVNNWFTTMCKLKIVPVEMYHGDDPLVQILLKDCTKCKKAAGIGEPF